MRSTLSTLHTALRKYRAEQAYIRALPHSAVFSDAILGKIAQDKPTTLASLCRIVGIGQVRRQQYGRDIVRLVNLQARSERKSPKKSVKISNKKSLNQSPDKSPRPIKKALDTASPHHSSKKGPNARISAVRGAPVSRKSRVINASTACIPAGGVGVLNKTAEPIVLSRFFHPPLPERIDSEEEEPAAKAKPGTKAAGKDAKKLTDAKATVYVLELEGGRVYVGSSKDVPRRLAQHLKGTGSAYTRAYPPTGVLLPRLGNVEGDGDASERDETLRYMMLRGVSHVRGWKFARVDMPTEECEEAEANIRELFDLCRRCGYKGHFCTHCKATFDRLGNPIGRF